MSKIKYLNTDLDISATVDVNPLVKALEKRGVLALHVTQNTDNIWFATFETEKNYKDPNSNIAAIIAAIDRLEEPEKIIWQSLTLCEFNIGYDCGDKPWAFNQAISNMVLQQIAGVGGLLRITLYPPIEPI